MVDKKIQKIIQELKVAREQKNISYQEIVNRTEENGEGVSLSTVKLVFSNKPKHNHSYEHVILPIIRAITPEDSDDIDIKLLQTRLDLKDELLGQKDKEIAELKERLSNKDLRYKEREKFYKDLIESYKEEIQFKNDRIRRFEENIDRKDAVIRELVLGKGKE